MGKSAKRKAASKLYTINRNKVQAMAHILKLWTCLACLAALAVMANSEKREVSARTKPCCSNDGGYAHRSENCRFCPPTYEHKFWGGRRGVSAMTKRQAVDTSNNEALLEEKREVSAFEEKLRLAQHKRRAIDSDNNEGLLEEKRE